MKTKRYLVSGCAGFIGSHLTEALLAEGHEVVGIDNLYSGFESYLPKDEPRFTFVKVDISDWNELSKNFAYFQNVDCIFHLAAIARIQPSIYNPSLTYQYNVMGTHNILQLMRMCNIPAIVYSASSSYYGKQKKLPFEESDPFQGTTPYATTKYFGEVMCKNWGSLYDLKTVCLKYFNVFGRRSPLSGVYAPVVSKFFRQAITGEDITVIGDGSQTRDMTHVGDVVAANIAAAKLLYKSDAVNGMTFNIGTGKNYSILDVAKKVTKYFDAKIVHLPERVGETQDTLADIQLAQEFLEWEPGVSLELGMDDLAKYYANNLEAIKSGKRDL